MIVACGVRQSAQVEPVRAVTVEPMVLFCGLRRGV